MFLQNKPIHQLWWAGMVLLTGLLAAACSSVAPDDAQQVLTGTVKRSGRLTPFLSATPSHTAPAFTPTPLPPVPTPSPTPRTHEVKKGEDMFGIALRYGVTLDELMSANPDVDPNFLSIGSLLVVPPSSQPVPGAEAQNPGDIDSAGTFRVARRYSLAHEAFPGMSRHAVYPFRCGGYR